MILRVWSRRERCFKTNAWRSMWISAVHKTSRKREVMARLSHSIRMLWKRSVSVLFRIFPSPHFFSHFQNRCRNGIYQTVKALVASLHVPITAKMRISSTCEETIAFAKMLERAGCKMIAIHGRRKEQKDHTVQPDWEIIKETMYHLSTIVIP